MNLLTKTFLLPTALLWAINASAQPEQPEQTAANRQESALHTASLRNASRRTMTSASAMRICLSE